jgi:hypothetical protein
MSSGISCLNCSVSIIVGCFGNAPISSKRCTIERFLADAPAAGLGVAGFSVDWALEPSVGVWLWGSEDWELLSDVLCVSVVVDSLVVVCCSGCEVSDPIVSVICTLTSGAVTGTLGVTSTGVAVGFTGLAGFSGLTGLVGLVGFVSDFTHEFSVVTLHVG